jgi:hypothetical protein
MLYFWIFIQTILLFILVFSVIQFYNVVFRGFAPFISTKFNAILAILKELDLKGDEVIYELGAGKAGFLRAVEQKFKNQRLIGVEYSWWIYFLAKIQIKLANSNIKLLNKNIFKVNLKEADLIYCFLSPEMMDRLEKKIKEECRPGTEIVSYHFSMPNMNPEKIIKEGKNNIYFYQI